MRTIAAPSGITVRDRLFRRRASVEASHETGDRDRQTVRFRVRAGTPQHHRRVQSATVTKVKELWPACWHRSLSRCRIRRDSPAEGAALEIAVAQLIWSEKVIDAVSGVGGAAKLGQIGGIGKIFVTAD